MSLLPLFQLQGNCLDLMRNSSHSTRGMDLLTCIITYFINTMGNISRGFYRFKYQAHKRLPQPLPDST